MRLAGRFTIPLALCALLVVPAVADDWSSWRGPEQNGTSAETALLSSWSLSGANLAWRVPFVGRSTPVVVGGQVCVIGRVGEDMTKQEVVACFDAASGSKRWERRHPVYHTTVAFNRLGWASLAGDSESGNIYAHGAAGQLIAFDAGGEVLWERFLPEEMGRASGYGGRTQTPIVWGDQLLLTFVSIGWGDQAAPRHRYYSFDKLTGELNWVSTPGNMVYDMNTQSGPVVAEIGGRGLLIVGNADGNVYAVDLMTGNKVWSFPLSRRGLNSTVLVDGDVVYVSHSEENLDDATMGRLVAFKATGSGDLSGQELWRINELSAGFPSPAFLDGKLYVVDNSANLHRFDGASGEEEWEFNLGTVGKASPVLADGKIYVPEVNGRFHILKIGEDGPTALDQEELLSEGERYAEIYGSPAIAYGKVYLSTEGWLYALGGKGKAAAPTRKLKKTTIPKGSGEVAYLRVFPADVELEPGARVTFEARAFDAAGWPLASPKRVQWSTENLAGSIGEDGSLTLPTENKGGGGAVVATVGELSGAARVRVVRSLPWEQGFGSMAVDAVPVEWVGARGKFKVAELDGEKVLQQPVKARGLQRSATYLGGDFSNYTIEADVMGSRDKRRITDVGLINAGYTMDLMGYHQRIEIRSWAAEKRMAGSVDYAWEMDTWYRMKMRVDVENGKAVIRGKVWKRDEQEPADWSITVEDPLPVTSGSPGLVGYAPSPVYYDNIKVTPNG